jgi:hypothetical protein
LFRHIRNNGIKMVYWAEEAEKKKNEIKRRKTAMKTKNP